MQVWSSIERVGANAEYKIAGAAAGLKKQSHLSGPVVVQQSNTCTDRLV